MIERYDLEGQLLFRLNFKNHEFMFLWDLNSSSNDPGLVFI